MRNLEIFGGPNVAGHTNDWGQPEGDHPHGPLQDVLKQSRRTKRELEKIALTLTAGQNWYGVPVQNVSAHLADYARCLVKDGLVWSLKNNAFSVRHYR